MEIEICGENPGERILIVGGSEITHVMSFEPHVQRVIILAYDRPVTCRDIVHAPDRVYPPGVLRVDETAIPPKGFDSKASRMAWDRFKRHASAFLVERTL